MSHLVSSSSPLISIVIPAYNRWEFLQQAIASVIAQTYTNWELFVVDDGSTDETAAGMRFYNDKRIHWLPLSHCGNVAVLRNAGAKASKGEWIAFLDSDDLWLPEKLLLQLEHLQKENRLWSYCRFELMNTTSQSIPSGSDKHPTHSGWITKELLLNEVSVTIVSIIVHRKLFEELNGFTTDAELIYREDYEFILRLSLKAEVAAVPNLLVHVREHTGRSTHAIEDAHKRTAFMYGYFANYCRDKRLQRIARSRQAYHETEIAGNNLKQKKFFSAILHFNKAFWKGDKLRHIFSVLRHSRQAKNKSNVVE